MQRRTFIQLSALAAAGYAIDPAEAAWGRQPKGDAGSAGPWPAPYDSAPVLQNPGSDAMTVAVAVKGLSTAWVEFGTSPALGERADSSRYGLLPLSSRVHRIRVEGLKPGTRYWYRMMAAPIDFKGPYKITRGPAVASGVHTFTTLDEGRGGRASFAVINDTHETPETLEGVTARLAAEASDMVFWNGDIFNDVRSDEQVVGQIYRPAGAEYAADRPLYFVSGNHDVRGVHARALEDFVDVPGGRRYGVLRQGPLAIVVLDTGEDKPDEHEVYAGLNDFARYRQVQARWLEAALRSEAWNSAAFRVAVFHIPLFGKGASEDSRAKWHGVLSAGRVDAAICGHIHQFLYTPPSSECRYGQLVGGGPKPEAATVVRVEADEKRMGLVVRDLAGKDLGSYEFRT